MSRGGCLKSAANGWLTLAIGETTMKCDRFPANSLSEAAMRHYWHSWIAFAALLLVQAAAAAPADDEAAYTRAITERAEKIVAPLGINDPAKATRVRGLIVNQYRGLREIHDVRDVAQNEAELKLFSLHRRFVARLAAELTPDEVERVKDGMTYGVVPLTYARYCELLPDLDRRTAGGDSGRLAGGPRVRDGRGFVGGETRLVWEVQGPDQQLPFRRRLQSEAGGERLGRPTESCGATSRMI